MIIKYAEFDEYQQFKNFQAIIKRDRLRVFLLRSVRRKRSMFSRIVLAFIDLFNQNQNRVD